MKLTREQINHYTNLFKECGRKNLKIRPADKSWYNVHQLHLQFFPRNDYVRDGAGFTRILASTEFSGLMKSFVRHIKNEGYSVDRRWENYKFHIYTSDIRLLDNILGDEQLRPLLKEVEYTSEQFERDTNKDRIVHTDILIRWQVDEFCYKVMLKQNWGDPARKADTLALLELCEANLENILWGGLETRDRMRSGSLWDNQHCVYTNDENLVTMMWLVAKPAIHKVYKIVQKEK